MISVDNNKGEPVGERATHATASQGSQSEQEATAPASETRTGEPRIKRYRRKKGNVIQRIAGNRWVVKGTFFAIFAFAVFQLFRFVGYALSRVPAIMSDQNRMGAAVSWLSSGNPAYSGLPPAIGRPEITAGILPVGHYTSFFAWLKGGGWDVLLPAGLVIIIGALVLSIFFKRGFCAWLCPVGTLWEACSALGRKVMGKNFKLPTWFDYVLRGFRYLITFALFFWLFSVSIQEAVGFRTLPYMFIADVKVFQGFTSPAFIAAFVLAGIASFLLSSVWCRYLCPLGGLYGALSACSPATITRDHELCIDCGACTKACHAFVNVEEAYSVRDPECDGCMDCVHACPVQDALEMRVANRWIIPAWLWPLLAVGTFLLIYGIAKLTGHWNTTVPADTFAFALSTVGKSGGFSAENIGSVVRGLFGM